MGKKRVVGLVYSLFAAVESGGPLALCKPLGRGSTGYIDQAELRNVLKELGLHGRRSSRVASKAADLCHNFGLFQTPLDKPH
eukprot:1208905-Amphidinium_carterae.1